MYMFAATGGGGSGVRIEMNFDPNNPFAFLIWVVTTFAPIAEMMVSFLFTPFDLLGTGTSTTIAQILTTPSSLAFLWTGQWILGLLK